MEKDKYYKYVPEPLDKYFACIYLYLFSQQKTFAFDKSPSMPSTTLLMLEFALKNIIIFLYISL